MARLEFAVNCPRCGKLHKGKRRAGPDIRLEFECTGRVRSGHLCGQRFTVTFFDEESRGEKAKDAWLRGEGDQFTSFKLRRR